MLAYLNDDLVPVEQARVSVLDRGFLYGDAIFETVAAYAGTCFRLDRHIARFLRSAELLGITPPYSAQDMAQRLNHCLQSNGLTDAVLRFSLSRGRATRGLDVRGCVDPTFVILCFPARPYPRKLLTQGAVATLASIRRIPATALPPLAKTANYLNGILAFREATERGANEAFMLTTTGALAEGTVSNVFLVHDGVLRTPSLETGIIAGITREAVLEVADDLAIPVHEGILPAAELETAAEVFYTNTSATIMPVGRIDQRHYSPQGPMTIRLRKALHALIEREAGPCWAFANR